MRDIYIILDFNKCIFDANPAAIEIFPELGSRVGKKTIVSVHGWPNELSQALDDTQTMHKHVEFSLDDEKSHHFRASITPIFNGGSLLGWLILLHNVTDTVNLMTKLEEQATTDALTGIHNRLYFMEHAQNRIYENKRKEIGFAVLLFDIDKFKSVNDTYGHSAGDAVLRSTVKVISDLLRPYDLFARYGGEEFILMLSDTDSDKAYDVAERIRMAMENHITEFESNKISRTVSIGIAFCNDGAAELQDMIDNADNALYDAKESGRNQVRIAIN